MVNECITQTLQDATGQWAGDCNPAQVAFRKVKMSRSTHTFSELAISKQAWEEIATKLRAAEYGHAFVDENTIDMHGIGLIPETEQKPRCPMPYHCPSVENGVTCNSHPQYSRTQVVRPDTVRLFCFYGHSWEHSSSGEIKDVKESLLRQLDFEVAEKVMHWTSRGEHSLHGTPVFTSGEGDILLPSFSAEAERAIPLMAAMEEYGVMSIVSRTSNLKGWMCKMTSSRNEVEVISIAETFPEAVSGAAVQFMKKREEYLV